MRRFCYTVDVDRDVNIQIPGQKAAGSIDRGSGTEARFTSTERGLGLLLDLLDELSIRATFFFEGRTVETIDCSIAADQCIGIHGYDHEDMTKLGDDEIRDIMRLSYTAVNDRVHRPTCARMPYMASNDSVLQALNEVTGIRDDSSIYTEVGGRTGPYVIGNVTEHPVTRSKDHNGKTIAGYLWPMHEGKRGPEDYISMAKDSNDTLILGDHTWHMVESRDGGPMSEDRVTINVENTRKVLEGIMDEGYRPSTIV